MSDLTARTADLPKTVNFTLTDPASGATLGKNFSVAGTIDGTLSVTVTVTLTGPGSFSATATGVINAGANTWEAYFSGVPVGSGASLSATYSPDGPDPGPVVDNLTVAGTGVGGSIDEPPSGGMFTTWDVADGSGTYDPSYTLSFYITQAGNNLTGQSDPLAAGEGDAASKKWSKALKKLVKKIQPVPGSNFCLHLTATKGNTTIQTASGFFQVK